jgi:ATP-binding cassette, subfamily B, bacterial MsbA
MNAKHAAKMPEGSTWPMLARLFRHYLILHKAELGWAMFAMLIVAAGLSLQAHLIQPLFDNGLIDRRIGVMNTVILTLVGLTLIRGTAGYYQAYYMESVGQHMVARLQEEMYSKTLLQNLGFFASNPSATLTSRFISDLQRLKYAVTQIFNSGLRDTGTIIGLFVNMLVQDWQLTLLTMLILPLTVLPIRRFGRLTRKYARVNQEGTAKLAHLITQTLQHIRQVQSYTAEKYEQKRVHARIADVLTTTLKTVRVRALSSPVVELIGTIAIGVLMLYASRRIADGNLTPGQFASFVASLVMIVRPLKGLTSLNNNLQEGLAAAQRAFDLIDAHSPIVSAPNAHDLNAVKGDLIFNNVSLTYPDGTPALYSLNLTVPAGHTVAFVGASGAGKSSVLNLIPRFYDVSGGSITLDGHDLRSLSLTSLRKHVALVTQDIAIFDDTVAANIAYGAKLPEKTLIAAAKAASADVFIEALSEKYNTVLGENGLKLSGGQKQRLAIARAVAKNAPVLLLDEATAALDSKSERDVQTALEKLATGRTTLIVAHRLSTIKHAHTIYVLDAGKIIEHGNHASLLKKKSAYAKLWALQAGTENS